MCICGLIFGLCIALGMQLAPGLAGPCKNAAEESARVSSVVDGETLVLKDGREVRLLGILAPVEPPNWQSSEDWPFALQARQALAQLVGRGPVSPKFDTRKGDRYGHLLAHIHVARDSGAIWIQESLIAKVLAWVAAQPDIGACRIPLLAAEAEAREARRGIWRSLTYQILDAQNPTMLGHRRHTYQLVEGHVFGIGEGKKSVYINFGED
ncbi:MAG: thermonuclease family protein [Methyloceanibacter sp.]|jgi:endonuclease YncB( thermonuclease family)